MNKRIGALTILIVLGGSLFADFARAQSPQIVWQFSASFSQYYYSLKFTADNSQLIGGGEYYIGPSGVLITRFNAATGAQLATTPESYLYYGASEIALSPDEQKIITANFSTPCNLASPPVCVGSYLQYGAAQLNRLAVPPDGNAANYSVDYAPDGQLIALGGSWFNYAGFSENNLRLVRADNLTVVRTMAGHFRGANNGGTLSVRFSPDGTMLGTIGRDRFVKIWRVSDGALLRSINFDDAYELNSAEFSPDGQFIAAGRGGTDARVKVWRVSTGELVKTFEVSPGGIAVAQNKVAWTRGGSHVVAGIKFNIGLGNSRIKFWNFSNGQLAEDYDAGNARLVHDLVFSPNGQRFAYTTVSQIVVAANPFPGAPFAGFRTFADFDGDRKADVSVFRSGTWYIQASTAGFRAAQFGLGTDKIVPADYDGDTKTDIAVVRDGIWYILNSQNNSFRAVGWGFAGDTPVPGDYDGDGKADIAVFRSGIWYILQSADSEVRAVQLGDANSKPVAADYDADGKTDAGVFQNGAWSLLRSGLGAANFVWGRAGDKPVPADYDGDGFADPAVFGANGAWNILRSNGGVARQVGYVELDLFPQIRRRAVLWNGSADNFTFLSTGFSEAFAVGGDQQVGYVNGSFTCAECGTLTVINAALWRGSPDTFVNLHPLGIGCARSYAYDTDGVQQVGEGYFPGTFRNYRALLWSGTRQSVIDLSPPNNAFNWTTANAVKNGVQVGYGVNTAAQAIKALLWRGTAASVVELGVGIAYDTNGATHGGEVDGGNYSVNAFRWDGDSGAGFNLHALLPPGVYEHSRATGIDQAGNIIGWAQRPDGRLTGVLWRVARREESEI